jgi:hypothetical protein
MRHKPSEKAGINVVASSILHISSISRLPPRDRRRVWLGRFVVTERGETKTGFCHPADQGCLRATATPDLQPYIASIAQYQYPIAAELELSTLGAPCLPDQSRSLSGMPNAESSATTATHQGFRGRSCRTSLARPLTTPSLTKHPL